MAYVKYIGAGWQSFKKGVIYEVDLRANPWDRRSWFVFIKNAPFSHKGQKGYCVCAHQSEFEIISQSSLV